ncbi:hypothetical protein PTNB85_09706 [Pyrenophora teres f. teres]|uniref:FabG n=1 Tax=Pyrenophora teres f. teres TaxID=97479 RepID=A0A6S6WBT6_9PLEO|nr:hypothetical protein PTNB85_09706 [Pyrenophora teres f. teres]KAE8835642.1 hypothetical protein HRS9122_07912 [Pyrenophora teres f. teres]KAE8858544.1 hypothetical protein PTNB29_07759 [Pyrenophora teres f. teres]CAE7205580.1 FabG [Pyrenophora teres f. teres]
MASKPVALILGAGPNLGASIATSLAALGYRIATASRSGSGAIDPSTDILRLRADFTNPSSIPPLFTKIKETFSTAPSVVIYNAANLTRPSDPTNPLSIPTENFEKDLNVNTVSAYVAAQEAVKGWEALGSEGGNKTFVFTGNMLNQKVIPMPNFLTLGVGKSASAHWVGLADQVFRGDEGKKWRFFYADQRLPDGAPMMNGVNGAAHGDLYAQLVQHESDVPWLVTFVHDKGYVKF